MEGEPVQTAVSTVREDATELLGELRAGLAQVLEELRGTHERAAARERVIERLHEDNQRLRAGERQLVLRPVLVDLQRLRNELLREAAVAANDPALPGEAVEKLLVSFAHSVEQALERGGVLVVRPAVGNAFDPAQHRAVQAVRAADGEDGTVAAVVTDGYRDVVTDRTLAPAAVTVARHLPAGQPSGQPAGQAEQPAEPAAC